MSIFTLIFGVFNQFVNIRDIYNEIKNNEEAKQVSTVMARKSILFSILFLINCAGAIALIVWGVTLIATFSIIFGIIVTLIGITLAFYSLVYLPLAINALVKQFCLNKKPLSWVALSLLIIIILALIIGSILIFSGALK